MNTENWRQILWAKLLLQKLFNPLKAYKTTSQSPSVQCANDIRKGISLLEGSHASPTCSSDNGSASIKMNIDGKIVTREAEVLGEQSVPLPMCPPEIWGRTRASVMKDR